MTDATRTENATRPWKHWKPESSNGFWYVDEDEGPGRIVVYSSDRDVEADARLIAAAPDLLAALETVKRVLQGEKALDIMLTEQGPCLGDVVRDAIDKARGK